jgi:hypothetical protein
MRNLRNAMLVAVVAVTALAAIAGFFLGGPPLRILVDAGLAVALAVIVVVMWSPTITRVDGLVEALRALARGDRHARVEPEQFAGLAEVARAVNEVAASLTEGEDPNLGSEGDACSQDDDCSPGGVDGCNNDRNWSVWDEEAPPGGTTVEKRCVLLDYSWCTHRYFDRGPPVESLVENLLERFGMCRITRGFSQALLESRGNEPRRPRRNTEQHLCFREHALKSQRTRIETRNNRRRLQP